MLSSQQHVPRIIFMQISAVFIETNKCFIISRSILQTSVQTHVFRVKDHYNTILELMCPRYVIHILKTSFFIS